MFLSILRSILSSATIVALLTVGILLQTHNSALADYNPPGGDPPPGRTSTSGMSLH